MTYSTAQARPGPRIILLSRVAAFLSLIIAAIVQPAPGQTTLEPACNDFANLASIAPTVEINSVNTGADCVGCVIHDIGNIPQVASYGTLEFPEDVAATIRVSVKSTSGQLPAGTLAGTHLAYRKHSQPMGIHHLQILSQWRGGQNQQSERPAGVSRAGGGSLGGPVSSRYDHGYRI